MKIISTILLFLSTNLLAQERTLNLASDVWPPFTNVANERAFAKDLVNSALNRSGIKVTTTMLEFDEVLMGIGEGKHDGSAALWHSEEREKNLLFSDPYLQNRLILVGKKDSDVSAVSFKDLGEKRLAVVGTYAYGNDVIKNPNLTLIEGKSDQQNLERLLKGEADYMLVDALLIQYLLTYQQNEVKQFLAIGTKPLLIKNLHFAIRKDVPDAANIIRQFNNEIIKMVADGSYNKVLQLNWIRADVNGDGKMELVHSGKNAGTEAPSGGYAVLFNNNNTSGNSGYFVDGNFYQNWDQIPSQYKVPAKKKEDLGRIGMLSFKF